VVDPVAVQGMGQRRYDMLLADQLVERPRPPFTRQCLVSHGVPCRVADQAGPAPDARISCYGCFLPDLTGFTTYRRRERPTVTAIDA